jgi:hypothetical protein
MKPGEKNIQYNKTNNTAERVVEQIVTPRNFIVGFASVDNEFLGVTICSSILTAMCILVYALYRWVFLNE